MSRGGASAEDDAGWDAIGEKDGAIGYEAVLTDQRRQRRRIEHGAVEGRNGCVRRGMVGILDISPIVAHLHVHGTTPFIVAEQPFVSRAGSAGLLLPSASALHYRVSYYANLSHSPQNCTI